ncbi:MAG: hypothetical protein K2Y51_21230 [Gammaproteobacteria bacterium]|nr:hypothetical protein [Gammaproteobacteria bacterium]
MFAPDQVGFDTQVGVAGACAYTLIMALWRALPRGAGRDWSFTLLNLGFVYLGFFAPDWTRPLKYSVESLVTILVYLAAVTVHYRLLAEARKGRQQLWLLAIWLPIATLFAVKVQTAWQAMGLSYLSFRMALASMEIRDGRASLGSLAQYLGFLFFLPTFSLGPISPLSMYDTGMACGSVSRAGLLLGAGRILTGYLMFKVLAPFFQQLSFTNLLNDGFVHGRWTSSCQPTAASHTCISTFQGRATWRLAWPR